MEGGHSCVRVCVHVCVCVRACARAQGGHTFLCLQCAPRSVSKAPSSFDSCTHAPFSLSASVLSSSRFPQISRPYTATGWEAALPALPPITGNGTGDEDSPPEGEPRGDFAGTTHGAKSSKAPSFFRPPAAPLGRSPFSASSPPLAGLVRPGKMALPRSILPRSSESERGWDATDGFVALAVEGGDVPNWTSLARLRGSFKPPAAGASAGSLPGAAIALLPRRVLGC